MIPGILIVVLVALVAAFFGLPGRIEEYHWLDERHATSAFATPHRTPPPTPPDRVERADAEPVFAGPEGAGPRYLPLANDQRRSAEAGGQWVYVKAARGNDGQPTAGSQAAQALAQVDIIQRAIDVERAKSARLDRELAAARAELERSTGARLLAEAARQISEAVAKTSEAQRQAEHDKVAALEEQRSKLQNSATLAEASQKALVDARVKAAALEGQLAAAADQIAKAQAARRIIESSIGDDEAARDVERQRTIVLGERLSRAEQTAREAGSLQKSLDDERARAVSLDADLSKARRQLGDAQVARQGDEARRSMEQANFMATSQRLAEFERVAAQAKALEKALNAERATSAGLGRELEASRGHAAQTERQTLAAVDQRQRSGADDAAALQAERRRSETLRTSTDAAAQSAQAATKDFECECATRLDGEVARLPGPAAEAEIPRDRAEAARGSSTTARAAVQANADDSRRLAAELTGRLAMQERVAARNPETSEATQPRERASIAAQEQAIAHATSVSAALTPATDTAAGIRQAIGTDPEPFVADHAMPKASGGDPSPVIGVGLLRAPAAQPQTLPPFTPARVLLRYARDNASAHVRAVALGEVLRARGMDVSLPLPATTRERSSSVAYFYDDDRIDALTIAEAVAVAKPTRSRGTIGRAPPRPGTIEVTVAG